MSHATHLPRRLVATAGALLLAATLLTACGDDEESGDSLSVEETTTTEAETTTTEETTTTAGDETREQSGSGPWAATASELRQQVGSTANFDCPAGGSAGRVWGVNIYTDDSSVCTAAVQMGLITFEEGGTVTIKIIEGQDSYMGSEANGVTSGRYTSWGGSFEFPDATPLEVSQRIEWNTSARDRVSGDEVTYTVDCPPDGTAGNLWGTDTYTDDSSVCTAAVHAGAITLDDGGEVTFTVLPGQDSYQGSTANGVTSQDYGTWGASFRIEP